MLFSRMGRFLRDPKECRFLRELPDCRSFKNKTVLERPILLDEWHDDPRPVKVFGKDILRLLLDKPSLRIKNMRVICLMKIKLDYCMKLFVESIWVKRMQIMQIRNPSISKKQTFDKQKVSKIE